jgi:hypothetical protein
MSAPEFVPTAPAQKVRSYDSPPRRGGSWRAERPGDLGGEGQPAGERLGSPGPDQGYAYKLLPLFADRLRLRDGEDRHDVEAGCLAVALKRASLFSRAPVVHDLTVAFTVWGLLDEDPSPGLVERRRHAFDGVAHPHHYVALRAVADAVPAETLAMTPAAVTDRYQRDWQSLLTPAHP